jgi:hypothetical protein
MFPNQNSYPTELVSQILNGITGKFQSPNYPSCANIMQPGVSYLFTRTTMSRLSHGVTVEYLEEGLVVRSRK